MSQDRSVWFFSKVNTEVVIELHATILGVAVNHQHHRPFLEMQICLVVRALLNTYVEHVGVKLLVPGGEE